MTIPDPICDGDAYYYRQEDARVTLRFEQLRRESHGLHAMIYVEQDVLGMVTQGVVNLSSFQSRDTFVRRLTATIKPDAMQTKWNTIVENACISVSRADRDGTTTTRLGGKPYAPEQTILGPIGPLHKPTLFYGDEESAKSLWTGAAMICLAGGYILPGGLTPLQAMPALIVDYEGDENAWGHRTESLCRGMGVKFPDTLYYHDAKGKSLSDIRDRLKRDCARYQIGTLLLDNFTSAALAGSGDHWHTMAAVGYGVLSDIKGVTPWIITHQPSADSDQPLGAAKPFGGGYVRFLSRQRWHILRSPHDVDGDITISLTSKKFSYGPRPTPLGFRFTFPDPNTITLQSWSLDSDPSLLGAASLAFRAKTLLRQGELTTTELADTLQVKVAAVRSEMNRLSSRGDVVKLGESKGRHSTRWGLAAHHQEPPR